jgi:hypothetical protein
MSFNQGPIRPSKRYSQGRENTWGPYWDVLFPPAMVTAWVSFKRGSTGVNVARRFWAQREYLRRAYESVYGSDPEAWPSRHPGVVLDAVPYVDHPACLGCQWFGSGGGSALLRAWRHETSEGGSDG